MRKKKKKKKKMAHRSHRLSHDFKTLSHHANRLPYYPQMSVFFFHTFLFSETEHRNNVNPSLFMQMQSLT